ncbi:hypothetical protein Pmani_035042 [Petrolisthes manimaculis]|uniref:Aromatic amino acid beta-eliminating lyase/threonine aldolase domain-containing protein n=1 Tax=Petrolisthes manimaculis TaxID=1843537 RepID=A0AAE1NN42_9EUCA|nr:hypothetical protein Pmani_035042 [Petrolisthes manimaculis]
MVDRKKKDVVVTNMKEEYIGHSIEVTPFADSEIEGGSLSMGSLEDGGPAGAVPTQMTVSVEEGIEEGAEMEVVEMKHSPEKKRKVRIYSQKFRKEWIHLKEFQGWLTEGITDDRAHCTVCDKELLAGKSELIKHSRGKKHRTLAAKSNPNPPPVQHGLSRVIDEDGMPHLLRIVDLRSDTVTQPSREMKKAMMEATLGDDVFSEDPTVKTLEDRVAQMLQKEAALFVPSGTMANLICVMTHCWGRGSEAIVGDQSHLHLWAQGGMAQIGSVHHRTIKNLPDGTFSLNEVRGLVRDEHDAQSPLTSLICVENPHHNAGGKAIPLNWMDELGAMCSELGLPLHCDGARLINASVALGTSPARIVQACDSVSLCLNKGLGAPMGSLVIGTKEFIAKAKRLRKVLGGGLHQSGIVAAAGLWALDHVAPRLSWDHTHARALAQSVCEEHSSAVTVNLKDVHTNVVLLHCDNIRVNAKKLCQRLASVTDEESEELSEQIVVMALAISDTTVRLVTHCDIRKEDVRSATRKLKCLKYSCR